MKMLAGLALLSGALLGMFPQGVGAVLPLRAINDVEVRIWLDHGEAPVFRRGDRSRIYYRVTRDSHVAIFHISTDGLLTLVQPRTPESGSYVRGGREYRLLFPAGPFWDVDEHPGVGYFFALASPEPLDLSGVPYSRRQGSWDLSMVGGRIHGDPYAAVDQLVAWILPGWESLPYGLDFSEYQVGGTFEYPRFLCYDCHTFRPYTTWNPYRYSCSSFRLVIYDDPYYYPAARYRGSQVVFARPALPGEPRFAFKERAAGDPVTPLLEPRSALPRDGGVESGANPRLSPGLLLRQPGPAAEGPPLGGVRVLPRTEGGADGLRPTLQRRPPEGGFGPPPVRNPPPPAGSNPPPVRSNPPPVRNNPPPVRNNPPPPVNRPPPVRRDPLSPEG